MDLKEVAVYARKTMDEHGLYGWGFKYDNAKHRLGLCNYSSHVISMSKSCVESNGMDIIKDVLLHEIAHALVGSGHGHDKVWQAKAIEIGSSGNRECVGATVKRGKYKYVCDNCEKISYRHRRTQGKMSCGDCCRKYNFGRYTQKYVLRLTN
jgi:predicted SprT family Zn-dependent metalloprotease